MYWPPEAELLRPACMGEENCPDSACTICSGRKYCEEVHPDVSKLMQLELQEIVPPVKPRETQVWPARSAPSQVSVPSLILLPHVCAGVWQVPPTQHRLAQSELDWNPVEQVWPEEQHVPGSWEPGWEEGP